MRIALLLVPALLFAQDKRDATPPPTGTISGTVLATGTNEPMKDVEVYVNRGAATGAQTLTDSLGQYVLKNVTPGQVRISVVAPDSSGRRGGFGPTSDRRVTLAPSQDLANVDFHLILHGRIAGRVVDQNKEPVVGASVYLVAREYSHGKLRLFWAGASIADDEGNYLIDRVQPYRAYAVVARKGGRTLPAQSDAPLDPALRLPAFVPTYHPNAAGIEGAEMITLRPAEMREGVDIRVLRSQSFCMDAVVEGSGNMTFQMGESQPHSGQSGNGGMYTGVPGGPVSADGKVRVCDLHPGEYEFNVSTRNNSGAFPATTGFGSTTVIIGDHDVTNVHLALRPKIPVSGEVVWEGQSPDNPPKDKLRIDVEALTRTERSNTQTDVPGAFSFDGGLLMDEYRLDFRSVPAGAYIKDVSYGGRSILYAPLTIGGSPGGEGLRITLGRDGGTISTRVTNKDGIPVVDCSVVILPADASSEAILAASYKSGKTDQAGSWTSPLVPPGKYHVIATTNVVDRSPETIARLGKARTSAMEVDLAPSGKASITLEQ